MKWTFPSSTNTSHSSDIPAIPKTTKYEGRQVEITDWLDCSYLRPLPPPLVMCVGGTPVLVLGVPARHWQVLQRSLHSLGTLAAPNISLIVFSDLFFSLLQIRMIWRLWLVLFVITKFPNYPPGFGFSLSFYFFPCLHFTESFDFEQRDGPEGRSGGRGEGAWAREPV